MSERPTTQEGRRLLDGWKRELSREERSQLQVAREEFRDIAALAEEGLRAREAVERRSEITAEDIARDPRGCIWQLAMSLEAREERIATLEAANAGLVARVGELEQTLESTGQRIDATLGLARQLIGGWRATSTDAEWSEFDREVETKVMALHHTGLGMFPEGRKLLDAATAANGEKP